MSAGQVYDRWFLSPAVQFERTDSNGDVVETFIAPKYSDASGISGFSGTTTTPDIISDSYPALTQTYPDVEEWYIVRMYGVGNSGWNALNTIHNYQDTRTLADHANDVAPVLNAHFPELSRSGQEWADAFRVTFPGGE